MHPSMRSISVILHDLNLLWQSIETHMVLCTQRSSSYSRCRHRSYWNVNSYVWTWMYECILMYAMCSTVCIHALKCFRTSSLHFDLLHTYYLNDGHCFVQTASWPATKDAICEVMPVEYDNLFCIHESTAWVVARHGLKPKTRCAGSVRGRWATPQRS